MWTLAECFDVLVVKTIWPVNRKQMIIFLWGELFFNNQICNLSLVVFFFFFCWHSGCCNCQVTACSCFSVQVGLSQARRLAQGNIIRIHASSPFPVQIDGEPYIQQPGCIEITHHGQV